MDFALAHIPHISISPAPADEPQVEPYSPFSSSTRASPLGDDSFRPVHLTPPPTLTRFHKQLSPLRPHDDPIPGKGLERERFEALLQASRERNAAFGGKKAGDLRKEIALKAHKNKQVERRALFLSKVLAPPSPTATLTPKTPPDSPAIFHYSLPSPGLVSPLALFETLSEDPSGGLGAYGREPWVEQVDFRVHGYTKITEPAPRAAAHHGRSLPSLEQISARLSSQGNVRQCPAADAVGRVPERPRLPIGVGRLQMPVRAPKPALEPLVISPQKSPRLPDLQITTLVVPRTTTTSPTMLSEANLLALNSREHRAHNMLSTLRRRTLSSENPLAGVGADVVDAVKLKRRSAPADLMPLRARTGFQHPVLALPGGF
ncbi:hypothetical protein Hypma_015323 [Hypsizygus marmoreus]|uniref:Uncharacterized protein n=1 Tax=Hypsizygus marmoreus TaxID=39966 RepID=A0A369K398_HYPMA|nr:hypothetical protein Hypma_015323 [Hypsizygus marmoreus]